MEIVTDFQIVSCFGAYYQMTSAKFSAMLKDYADGKIVSCLDYGERYYAEIPADEFGDEVKAFDFSSITRAEALKEYESRSAS